MIEILSLLGGGAAGFLFKLIGTMVSNQTELAKLAIERQAAADESHDRAAQRDPGSWVRRLIVVAVLFSVIGAPFILSLLGVSTYVESTGSVWWNPLTWLEPAFIEVKGFLILDGMRTCLIAIIGFYFGGAAARGR